MKTVPALFRADPRSAARSPDPTIHPDHPRIETPRDRAGSVQVTPKHDRSETVDPPIR